MDGADGMTNQNLKNSNYVPQINSRYDLGMGANSGIALAGNMNQMFNAPK